MAISHTTRPPRGKEKDGKDYYFVSKDEFTSMEKSEMFLETALVHGHYYGTSRDEVIPHLEGGGDVILDIDVQGASKIRKKMEAVGIFILPPDMGELRKRLEGRNTEGEVDIEKRIRNARKEIEEAPSFDYIVINSDLSEAVSDVVTIISAERMRVERRTDFLKRFYGDQT
jgi:guanylate kinase